MNKKKPDFRNMTLDEIRENISTLNKVIKNLKTARKKNDKEWLIGSGIGLATIAGVGALSGGLALIPFMASMGYSTGKAIKGMSVEDALFDTRDLRKKFKDVYRARPGRKQFNIAARKERERIRREKKGPFYPGFPFA
jgi:hypothetical protein